MPIFSHLVKDVKLSVSDAWSLDLVEINSLTERKEEMDLSIMLNMERMQNGATKDFLGI